MLTSGQVNPMVFQAGHFDGTTASGIQNAIGIQAYVEGGAPVVPDSIALTLSTSENVIGVPLTDTALSLNWTASSPALVTFNYIENEAFPFPPVLDYTTSLTFDQMPTSETLTLSLDEATRQLHLTHSANAVINEITLDHTRSDGLHIIGTASDVPTSVDLAVDLNGGSVVLDVNANTLDLDIKAIQVGGFANTADFLGYNLGYAEVFVEDAPDLFAGYNAAANSFGVQATNPGESIGIIGVIIGDDETLELPSRWADPAWHDFSLIDDGTHGTAAARIIDLQNATLTLDASPTGETFQFALGSRSPLQLHVSTTPASLLTGEDILATCEVQDMPMGTDVDFTIDFPDQFFISAVPDNTQIIESIECSGHIGTLNFSVGVGDLPMFSGYVFDALGLLRVTSEPSGPNTGVIGFIRAHFWDSTNALPSSQGLGELLGDDLHDARMRVDSIPSFEGTWSNASPMSIGFDTGIPDSGAFLGGVQVLVSTAVDLLSDLSPAVSGSDDYVRFADGGAGQPKKLGAGAFGIDEFTLSSNDGTGSLTVHYAADAAHQLNIDVDSTFGGEYFPAYDIDLLMVVDAIPQSFDLTTNLSTQFNYTASSGINAITIDGTLDNSGPSLTDQTTVNFDALGLPGSVAFNLDPGSGATLVMDAPIELVSLELSSNEGILGGPYKHIKASVEAIPDDWTAAWGTAPNPHASLTTSGPLGPVSVILSRDIMANTPSKYDIFTTGGGNVDYSPFAREIDRRYFRLGSGDDDVRETTYMTRLDGLYGSTVAMVPTDDHVIMRKTGGGDIAFLSVKGTGFQCASAQLGPGSLQCVASTVNAGEINASINLPVAGAHPFFVGIEDPVDEFVITRIPDVPDTTSVVAGESRAHLDFSASAGDITVYKGPLPAGGETSDLLKVQLINTPSFVHLDWDLGFPGGVTFDISNPLEIRLVTQDGSDRTVVDMLVGDLSASWGVNTAGVDGFKCADEIVMPDPLPNIPIECGTWFTIVEAFANFDANPAIEGFVANYQREGSPANLDGSPPPAPDGGEWVPRMNFFVDNFSHIGVTATLEVCLVPLPPVPCVAPGVPVGHIGGPDITGDFNFDYWDLGGGFLDFLGDPDYVDNDPWDLWPLFHDQADHLFPFGP